MSLKAESNWYRSAVTAFCSPSFPAGQGSGAVQPFVPQPWVAALSIEGTKHFLGTERRPPARLKLKLLPASPLGKTLPWAPVEHWEYLLQVQAEGNCEQRPAHSYIQLPTYLCLLIMHISNTRVCVTLLDPHISVDLSVSVSVLRYPVTEWGSCHL